MTALHFTSVTSSPSSSLQLLIQIHLFVCQWKLQWHFWQLWRKQIVLSYYVLTDLWCAISHTDSALVLTGSSNLCLMIVKLQRSLPWGKPSVHIWLTVVWLHIVKKLLLNQQKGHLILSSYSMRSLIVHSRKNKLIPSLNFEMILNILIQSF